MVRACFGVVLRRLLRDCFGNVLGMFRICFGYAGDDSICFRDVIRIVHFSAYMFDYNTEPLSCCVVQS